MGPVVTHPRILTQSCLGRGGLWAPGAAGASGPGPSQRGAGGWGRAAPGLRRVSWACLLFVGGGVRTLGRLARLGKLRLAPRPLEIQLLCLHERPRGTHSSWGSWGSVFCAICGCYWASNNHQGPSCPRDLVMAGQLEDHAPWAQQEGEAGSSTHISRAGHGQTLRPGHRVRSVKQDPCAVDTGGGTPRPREDQPPPRSWSLSRPGWVQGTPTKQGGPQTRRAPRGSWSPGRRECCHGDLPDREGGRTWVGCGPTMGNPRAMTSMSEQERGRGDLSLRQ